MTDTSEPSKSQTHRVVRVFVSSTFRDMHEERDYLATHVFPDLRDRCRKRQVEFVGVDLRWGITEEQSKRGEVLPICLREIENCRPYFVGLLGERYGWVPDSIHPELISMQGWLEGHKEKSVTELEILHGVLNNPAMADRSFFYFRDPAYIETIPETQRSDFLSEDPASKDKLAELKERIRDSRLPIKENYHDPEAAGRLILEDLWAAIDKAFPEGEPLDPLDQEIADHEAFAQSRAKIYIQREQDFRRLDGHVQGDGPPLVLVGESGVGKSALIANWAIKYREAHPEDFMILHFIGSSPASADYVGILRRIMAEIKRRYDVPDEIPVTPEKLREALPLWLASASAKGRLILILDGLNQLEDRDNALHLGWLPDYFPPNVRLLLSTLPGPSQAAAEKRNWPKYEVKRLDHEERRTLIEEYLARSSRRLSEEQLDRIVNAEQTSNPLYLKVLLDELDVFGIHEQLGSRIGHYLAAQTIPDLYEKVLERLEEDYEKDYEDLVGDAMSFLWASRRGLYESELLELLGDSNQPIPRAIWSPLYLAVEESLVNRGGLLNFFHDYLRQAVERRYIPSDKAQRNWHGWLADYFESRETDGRRADELPWQLEKAEEWESLKDCTTDIPIFMRLMADQKRYELVGYWLKLGYTWDMVTVYQDAVSRYEAIGFSERPLGEIVDAVALFLSLNARSAGAESMFRRAVQIREQRLVPDHEGLARTLHNLASLLMDKGDYQGAESACRRALEIAEQIFGCQHLYTANIIEGFARLLQHKADYEGAEVLFTRALAIREQALDPGNPDIVRSLNNLASLFMDRGDYEKAELLFRRALRINEEVLGAADPTLASSLSNLASLLHAKGDFAGADPLARKALEIAEQTLGGHHPQTAVSLSNLASVLQDMGRLSEAMPLYMRALKINETVLGPNHPATARSLNALATVYEATGVPALAEAFYRRALEIRESVLGPEHPETALTINSLANLFQEMGDFEQAESLHTRALAIREKVLGPRHPDTATSLNNLASLHYINGDLEKAEPLCRRALEICRASLGPLHPYTVKLHDNLAALLKAKDGSQKIAIPRLIPEQIWSGIEEQDSPAALRFLVDLADSNQRAGDNGRARQLYHRVIAACERLEGEGSTKRCTDLDYMSGVCHHELAFHTYVPEREWENAEYHYKMAFELLNKSGAILDAAYCELNRQTMHHISGQCVDFKKVQELTQILEDARDQRAMAGKTLLKKQGLL
jgi:nephrocystin-3